MDHQPAPSATWPLEAPHPKLSTQNRIVLKALCAGKTLTNIVAITCFGVGSLTSRIAELRRMGYPITDELDTTSDVHGRTFKKYRISPDDAARISVEEGLAQ